MKALLEKAIALAAPWDCEAILSGGECTVLRFANNRFHQNVKENRYQLYLRLLRGKRMGAVYVDDFSDASLSAAVARAREIASLSEEDPELLELPGPESFRTSPGRFDPEVARLNLDEVADRFAGFFSRCEAASMQSAGKLELVSGTIGDYGQLLPLAMMNSRGLFVEAPATWVDFSTTVFGAGSSGWAGNASRKLANVGLETLMDRALEKAKLNREQKDLPPGKYTVLLEPAAVHGLLGYLSSAFNAQDVLEGKSFVSGKLGTRELPEWFSLRDDAYDPRVGGSPFDGEGTAVKPVDLVSKGVLQEVVSTRALAQKLGKPPTGHGFFLPNPGGAIPQSVVMSGGEGTLGELARKAERALLVTRVWYTTPVDEKRLVISGMTRDGTFLMERGEIKGAVRNLRFNQSLPEMLRGVLAAGAPVPCFGTVVPPLLVDGFNFTSSTAF